MLLINTGKSIKKGGLRRIVFALVLALAIIGALPDRGYASMVPADEAAPEASLREANIEKVRVMLERKQVESMLADYGLTSEEVGSRLGELTDEQISELAARADRINAGGDPSLGYILGVLLVVLLVLLILHLLGYIDITPKRRAEAMAGQTE